MEDMAASRSPPPAPDEGALVRALRDGDAAAYEEFVRKFCEPMLAVAGRVLRHDEDARDAVQDAFLNAYKAIGRFDGRSSLNTWLHRIVVNAALMKLRSRRRKPERTIEDLLPHFTDDEHQIDPPARWTDRLADDVFRRELRDMVRAAIDRLPEIYRTVLLLRDIEQLDTDETARLLGTSLAVVKTRLHRARQALRTLLDPQLREPTA
jgi:RNA polymerase sigma-70 factor (ECF subfamily)